MRVKTFFIATILIAAVTFLLISSCAISPMKGYIGPDLSSDKTAIIENGVYIDIVKYDGIKLSSYQNKIIVLPGDHTIEIALRNQMLGEMVLYSQHIASITFNAAANHTYVVYAQMAGLHGWQARVIDKKTGDQVAYSGTLPVARK
jgi:hypothetical protein